MFASTFLRLPRSRRLLWREHSSMISPPVFSADVFRSVRPAPRPLYFHIAFPEQVAVRLIALIDFVEHDLVIDVADVGDARSAINIVTRRKETR